MVKYEQALSIIDDYDFKHKIQTIDAITSLNYVLAEDIYAKVNVPNFRKSAMDGYAINKDSDLTKPFEIIAINYAGEYNNPKIDLNQCVRIMTGAFVPDDANRIIVQELANVDGENVTFTIPQTKLNDNLCNIGEDIANQTKLFSKGKLINATMISSLISSGNHQIKVYPKPNILLLTTGDEIVNNDVPLQLGQIYNSNHGYLQPRLLELGFECTHKHIEDQPQELTKLLNHQYDLIISTGAISVGDKDIVRKYIVNNQANILFDRVNIMPGGPVVFWEHNDIPIISLAGSPFANFVTFELFARRIIAHLAQDKTLIPKQLQLTLDDNYQKYLKKRRFVKAHATGELVSIPANNHLASSMHEMCLCNGLINLERGEHNKQPGDIIEFIDLRRYYE